MHFEAIQNTHCMKRPCAHIQTSGRCPIIEDIIRRHQTHLLIQQRKHPLQYSRRPSTSSNSGMVSTQNPSPDQEINIVDEVVPESSNTTATDSTSASTSQQKPTTSIPVFNPAIKLTPYNPDVAQRVIEHLLCQHYTCKNCFPFTLFNLHQDQLTYYGSWCFIKYNCSLIGWCKTATCSAPISLSKCMYLDFYRCYNTTVIPADMDYWTLPKMVSQFYASERILQIMNQNMMFRVHDRDQNPY